jgi:hypothetical protein
MIALVRHTICSVVVQVKEAPIRISTLNSPSEHFRYKISSSGHTRSQVMTNLPPAASFLPARESAAESAGGSCSHATKSIFSRNPLANTFRPRLPRRSSPSSPPPTWPASSPTARRRSSWTCWGGSSRRTRRRPGRSGWGRTSTTSSDTGPAAASGRCAQCRGRTGWSTWSTGERTLVCLVWTHLGALKVLRAL